MQDSQHVPLHHISTGSGRVRGAKKSKSKTILAGVVVLAIAALGTLVVFQQMKLSAATPEEEARGVRDEVAQVMLLPEEEALVSEIEDAANVRTQAFFANVENGDKVLVFPEAAKIVLYRPSTKQVVNTGPIIDDTAPVEGEITEEPMPVVE